MTLDQQLVAAAHSLFREKYRAICRRDKYRPGQKISGALGGGPWDLWTTDFQSLHYFGGTN